MQRSIQQRSTQQAYWCTTEEDRLTQSNAPLFTNNDFETQTMDHAQLNSLLPTKDIVGVSEIAHQGDDYSPLATASATDNKDQTKCIIF